MTLRKGHGTGAGSPRIEVRPPDEQARPVPAPAAPPTAPLAFRSNGQIGDSETAKALGRRGGLAKAQSVRLVTSLGLTKLAEDSAFGPYRRGAEEFTAHHAQSLASQAGGLVGPAPHTMIASAALQLAGSRFCFDRFADTAEATWLKLGSSLANDSRQNLLAAYELAVREAQVRAAHGPAQDPLAAFRSPRLTDGAGR